MSRALSVLLFVACSCGDPVDPGPALTPILDRTPRLGFDCAIEHELTVLGEDWIGTSLAPSGGGYRVGRVGSIVTTPMAHLSTLELTPAIAVGPELFAGGADLQSLPATAARGDETAMVWTQGLGAIRFVRLDAAGQVAAGPVDVPGTNGVVSFPKLVGTAGGWTLLWLAGDYPNQSLWAQRLDDAGVPAGAALRVDDGDWIGEAVAVGDEVAVVYTKFGVAQPQAVHFAMLDAAGILQAAPVRLSQPASGAAHYQPTLVAMNGGFFAAWTESWHNGSFEAPEAYEAVQLARLDAAGARVGAIERLQAQVVHVSNTRPRLFAMGSSLGVAWSSGSVIYICGGCVPDHTLEMVLLDPADLVPVSGVVELSGVAGLFATNVVAAGDRVLALFDVTFHVNSHAAAATLLCTPR